MASHNLAFLGTLKTAFVGHTVERFESCNVHSLLVFPVAERQIAHVSGVSQLTVILAYSIPEHGFACSPVESVQARQGDVTDVCEPVTSFVAPRSTT